MFMMKTWVTWSVFDVINRSDRLTDFIQELRIISIVFSTGQLVVLSLVLFCFVIAKCTVSRLCCIIDRGGSRPMQPMRMHRSEFHVNLITRSRVSIETQKNNKIHNLISKCMRVVPREALLWYYRSKQWVYSKWFQMDSNLVAILCVFFLSSFYRYI